MRLRPLLAAGLVLVTLLGSGCFVLDELDKGNAELDAHLSKDTKAKLAAEQAAKDPKVQKAAENPKEKQKNWWSTATSLSTADQAPKDDPHVVCRIGKKDTFMTQSNCASQNGKVVKGS